MGAWPLSLISVVLVSLVSLGGLLTLSLNPARLRRLAEVLVSFAVGALLGDSFIHLIPEAFESEGLTRLDVSLLILSGMMLFFLVEKLLRHHHGLLHHHSHTEPIARPELAAINLVGDGLHNFIDGALIGASYLVSPTLGVSTTVAVLLHELPQELGDFGVLIRSGLSVRKAVLFNLGSASMAIAGCVLTLLLGETAEAVVKLLIPIAAGGFVYIATADLIPELQHDRSLRGLFVQGSLICAGVAVMALLTRVG